ncbi:hypothetical protein [Psychrobacillus phage Perkons]|nr:hypothetical protein [Psychrobacillus phage Perkons]
MNMRQNLIDLYNNLQKNEILLRLLYYKPKNGLDNPLDTTKANVLDMKDKANVIKNILVPSDKTIDLTLESEICRICLYNGSRRPQHNYFAHDQDFVLDVYVHFNIDEKDFRLTWILDHLNSLMGNKEITGAGKVKFVIGTPIIATPKGYIGYKMVYQFIGLED